MNSKSFFRRLFSLFVPRKFHCEICLEIIRPRKEKVVRMNCCRKKYHYDCVKAYASACMGSLDVPMRCPDANCSSSISNRVLTKILPEKDYALYQKRARIDEATRNPDRFTFCSTPNCEEIFLVVPDKPERYCLRCSKSTCTVCKVPFHTGLTCLEYRNYTPEDYKACRAFSKQKLQRCMKCRLWVERTQGCNHIWCRCGFEFCYVCSKKWKTCKC